MNTQEMLDPKSWAERTFGGVQLHDLRRTRRAVKAATKLAENPLGSLPAQMRTWKETKALYRLRGCARCELCGLDAASPAPDQGPSEFLSRSAVGARYHRHRSVASSTSISGVGHIGNERGRGFFVQTVLAVRPQTREVLLCMAQEPFVRIPAPEGEQGYQRRKREERETDVWIRQVHAIGTPEPARM